MKDNRWFDFEFCVWPTHLFFLGVFFFPEYFPLLGSKQMMTCCTVIWILGCCSGKQVFSQGFKEEKKSFSYFHCNDADDEFLSDLNLGLSWGASWVLFRYLPLWWSRWWVLLWFESWVVVLGSKILSKFFFPLQVFHNVIIEADDEFSLIWILGCLVGQGFLFGSFRYPKRKS